MESLEPPGRDELDEDPVEEGAYADADADQGLVKGQGVATNGWTTEFYYEELDTNGDKGDNKEEHVVEEALEDVEFSLTEFSWVNLVENLHENKCVEQESVMSALSSCSHRWWVSISNVVENSHVVLSLVLEFHFAFIEWAVSSKGSIINKSEESGSEENDNEYNDLIECLSEYISPHDLVDNLRGPLIRRCIKERITGRFRCECECREGVHDEVDPEHLDGGQRGVRYGYTA